MAEEDISLKPFLLGDPPDGALSQCVKVAAVALTTGLGALGQLDWSDLATEIAQKLKQMFDIKLIDVLATAWKDYEALTESADPTRHPADETISLPMLDHRVETSLRPCLEVVIGARPAIRIQFEITCDIDLKGLVLKIEDATICAIRIGSCRAAGSVKCEGVTVIKRETKDLDLPGKIVLAHGIAIGSLCRTSTRTSEDRGLTGRSATAPGTRMSAGADLMPVMSI
jgi:hypothetical protein